MRGPGGPPGVRRGPPATTRPARARGTTAPTTRRPPVALGHTAPRDPAPRLTSRAHQSAEHGDQGDRCQLERRTQDEPGTQVVSPARARCVAPVIRNGVTVGHGGGSRHWLVPVSSGVASTKYVAATIARPTSPASASTARVIAPRVKA